MTYQSNRPNIPIALVATKIDLITDHSKLDQAQKIAQEKGWMFHKTSAKDNVGINELFESLICKFLNIPMTIQNSTIGILIFISRRQITQIQRRASHEHDPTKIPNF